jgi:uncharacterized protein DUF5655
MPVRKKTLWTCPKCGRQFGSVNKWHSCGHYNIDDHFVGKPQAVRELYEKLLRTLEQFGPVSAYALKTRIVFQAETQFAAVTPRQRGLEGTFWLKRRAAHPLIRRIEMQVYRDYGHLFQLTRPEELDEAFSALLHEAYVIGNQR